MKTLITASLVVLIVLLLTACDVVTLDKCIDDCNEAEVPGTIGHKLCTETCYAQYNTPCPSPTPTPALVDT